MEAIFFITVTVVYLAYASRGPSYALAATAALMPFNQIVPSGFIPAVNVATIALAVALWAAMKGGDSKSQHGSLPAALPLFAAIIVLAYVHSWFVDMPPRYAPMFDPWMNFLKFKEWLTTILLCVAAFRVSGDKASLERIVKGGVLGYGTEVVFCFLEYVVKGGRVTGHLEEANSTGAFLATYAALSLGIYLAWKGDKRRYLFLGLGAAGAIATAGTRSRGGFLALGASFLLTAFAKNKLVAILLIVMAVTYQQWMPAPLLARFDVAYKVSDEGQIEAADTAASRIEIWKAGFRTIPDYPLGLGFGKYAFIVPIYGLEEIMHRPMKNAHNDFVLVTVEFSVLGGLVLLALLAAMLRRAYRVSARDPDPMIRSFGAGAFGGLVGAMAACFAVSLMFRLDFGAILWIFLGITARRAVEIDAMKPADPKGPPRPAPAVARR